MFPHRDGCRDRSCRQSRRAPDWKRKTRPHYYAHNCALPGNDTRNGHTDFRLALSKATSDAEDVGEIFGVECFQNIWVELTEMLCDVCKCNDATVVLTQMLEGRMHKVNLCE